MLSLLLLACVGGGSTEPVFPAPTPDDIVFEETRIARESERIALDCQTLLEFDQIRSFGDGVWAKTGPPGVSYDDGATWQEFEQAAFRFEEALPLVFGPVVLAFGSPASSNLDLFLVSDDGGETFAERAFDQPAPGLPYASAATDLGAAGELAITPTGRVFHSTGGDWKTVPDGFLPDVAPNTARHARGDTELHYVAGLGAHLSWTDDGGETWSLRRDPLPFGLAEVFPDADGTWVARWSASGWPDAGYAWSTDAGETWRLQSGFTELVTLGPGTGELWALTVSEITPAGEVVSVLHTVDAGASWSVVEFVVDGQPIDGLVDAFHTLRTPVLEPGEPLRFGLRWSTGAGLCEVQ